MENALKERFIKIMELKSTSVLDFSRQIGIAQTTLNTQLSSSRGISSNVIMLTLNRFPDVSAEWLMRGKGEILHIPSPKSDKDFISIEEEIVDDNNLVTIYESLPRKAKSEYLFVYLVAEWHLLEINQLKKMYIKILERKFKTCSPEELDILEKKYEQINKIFELINVELKKIK